MLLLLLLLLLQLLLLVLMDYHGLPWIPWVLIESRGSLDWPHGFHGQPWNPEVPVESTVTPEVHGNPWIPCVPIDSMGSHGIRALPRMFTSALFLFLRDDYRHYNYHYVAAATATSTATPLRLAHGGFGLRRHSCSGPVAATAALGMTAAALI